MGTLLLPLALCAASIAAAQPQPTETKPAETPQELAAQIRKVTDYLLEAQRWKKNAASGKTATARRERAADAAAAYRSQRELLQELLSRMELWAYIADDIDHDKPALTEKDVQTLRQRDLDALSSLRDQPRASTAPVKKP